MRRAAKIGDGWVGSGNTLEQLPEMMSSLQALHTEYDASGHFETIIGVNETPSVEVFDYMSSLGISSGVSYPFKYSLGERSALADKQNLMKDFARSFIK